MDKVMDHVIDLFIMKRNRIIYIIATIVAIILIFNFTPLGSILHETYTYRNYDNSFQDEEKSQGTFAFQNVIYDYRDFLKANPDKARLDSTLYRTFTIKPWRFWQWSDYLFCPQRFRLPYKTP